ncbi:unnamed protein product [Mytilus edulis]|uniref:B box-type domain-containing protein n=1 Tax=Mytilus edulis TaxID=6550 RepID=A0A8S3SX07_MYTED|nr:unnamed protein product [Mytilus edulis]
MQKITKTQKYGVQCVKRDYARIVRRFINPSEHHGITNLYPSNFRQIQNITVSFNCKDHDRRLELYCKTHDVAVCLGCVPSRHRTCSDVIPLDKAAENAKHSTALADLEDTFTRTLKSLQEIIIDRDSALKNFKGQEQTIKHTINDTRVRIMKKLDRLEQKLLLELNTKHGSCKSEVNKLLNRMKNSERYLNCLREQTSQLKSFASDVQLFLGTRQINKAVYKEVESVKEEINSVQNYEMNIQLHPLIVSLMNEVDQLGKLSIKKTATILPFKDAKVDQAQIQLQMFEIKSIDTVSLQLKKRFEYKDSGCHTGCTILPNGNVLIADYNSGELREYSEDGKYIRDIPCSVIPFDLTVIDNDRIAVTYGKFCQYIHILNIKNYTIEKKVEFQSTCYGISYHDKKLFIILENSIVITDSAGKVLETLNVECDTYIKTAKDRIYISVRSDHTVNCLSMAGEKIWIHKVESLIDPRGITVDDHQNVFVVDFESKSLLVIQHDGKSSRTLLSKTDGLINPIALHYNKDKKYYFYVVRMSVPCTILCSFRD